MDSWGTRELAAFPEKKRNLTIELNEIRLLEERLWRQNRGSSGSKGLEYDILS